MNEQEVRLALLNAEKPIIVIDDDISQGVYEKVSACLFTLQARGSPPVEIIIDSQGGDVRAGLQLYDQVRLYPGLTTGSVRSVAASMAAIILQGCKSRVCARHAEILIHHISRNTVSLDALMNKGKLSKIVAEAKSAQARLDQILVERTGKPMRLIHSICKRDKPMTAEEALEFGLIDQIV